MNTPGSQTLWGEIVRRILADSPRETLLDVCCGERSATKHLDFKKVVACDVVDWPRRPVLGEFYHEDALSFLRRLAPREQFDLAICSDGLEHFPLSKGREVLTEMERVARLALVFVPTGDPNISPESQDPHTHKASWADSDFKELGWETLEFPNWHPTLGWGAMFAWKKSS